MRPVAIRVVVGLWFAVVALLGATPGAPAFADGRGPRRIVVQPRQAAGMAEIANRYRLRSVREIGGSGWFSAHISSGDSEAAILQDLADDQMVANAEPDPPVVAPEVPTTQLAFGFDSTPGSSDYTNPLAFSQVNLGQSHWLATGRGVRVAILDTGINASHPALAGHIGIGYNAIDPSCEPVDGPTQPLDDMVANAAVGHGTMVAGIIVRLAPNATLLPVKVLGADGYGSASDVAEGIYWSIWRGADVINMSFGTASDSSVVAEAVRRARQCGIVMVASAGNCNSDLPRCPASLQGVISVSSVEADNVKSPYAAFGRTVDFVAPGTGIRSTYWNGGYASWSGTSFSAAFVSGAAALVRELRPQGAANRIENILSRAATSVDAVNPDYVRLLGDGLINIERSVWIAW